MSTTTTTGAAERDEIVKAGIKIGSTLKRLRDETPRPAASPVRATEWKMPATIPPRWHVAPDSTPERALRAGLRFWAEAVAPRLTYDEWLAMVERAEREARPFRGDLVRVFENLFDGLTLKDGHVVVP